MDLTFLRSFVEVAKRGHVGRAAEALGLAQPSVSYQLARLEESYGVALFERGPRGMRPTAAGTALLNDVEPLLRRFDELPERVRAAATGSLGELSAGFVAGAILSGLASQITRAYKKEWPLVNFHIRALPHSQLVFELRTGELDVAVMGFGQPDSAIVGERFTEEPFVVALPADHRLARRASVKYRDLAGERLVTLSRQAAPDLLPEILGACAQRGYVVQQVEETSSEDSVIGLVAAGAGIAIVPDSWAAIRVPGVVVRSLDPPGHSTFLDLVRRRDESSPLVHAFIATARRVSASTMV
jgi:DNA-binding transcriptional LysR family regulator